jgi:protein-S-isoprenylcysteine O-methyltransferase Ste14
MIARFLLREAMGLVVQAALLFGSSGRLDWTVGWVAMALTGLWVAGTAVVLIAIHPDLIAERLGPRPGTRRWDVVILSVIGLLMAVRCVLAGLDERYGWSSVSLPLWMVAVAVAAGGYGLIVWATWANAFFAQTARVQAERGQTVATSGPYRLVRHPGYLGALLAELALPLVLDSWWALLAGVAGALALAARTALEDRMLLAELDGYVAYARRVSRRLVPGLW